MGVKNGSILVCRVILDFCRVDDRFRCGLLSRIHDVKDLEFFDKCNRILDVINTQKIKRFYSAPIIAHVEMAQIFWETGWLDRAISELDLAENGLLNQLRK